MKELRWGIIGCGNVTEVKSGPVFNLLRNSSLVAVMRRNKDKAEDYAKRHGVAKWYGDADDLIMDPDVNAIYVATPPDTHAEYAIKAMEAGKPVYVEKPMALNFEECEKMLSVSERTNTPLFVAYYRRSLPGFRKVKELIDNEKIGKVRHINMQLYKFASEDEKQGQPGWRVDPAISGGGHFFDLGSHQLDYLDYLFGPVKEVSAVVKNIAGLYAAEDYVTAIFSYENGMVCSASWNFVCTKENVRDTIEIVGERGSISFSTYSFAPVRLVNQNGTREFEYPRPDHVQYYLIQEVVDSLLGNGEAPSTGVSAARTSKVMDQVVKEYYDNNKNSL